MPGSDENCDGESPRTRRAQKMTILGHQGRLPRGDGNLRGLKEGWEQAVQRAEGQRGPRVGCRAGGLWKLEVVLLERDRDFA